MPRRRSVLLMMLWSVVGVPVLLAQDFYEQQFQNGRSSLASGKAVEATTQLRIAAFGFLDRPALLSEALVHLAVAQSTLGHTDDAAETIARFMTVEQRFPSYGSLSLDPKISAGFESLLLKVIPVSTVAATPSLSRLVRTDVQKVADLPPARRMAAYESGFRKDSRNIQWPLAAAREAATRQAFDEMIEWGLRALSLDRNNSEALGVVVRARTARRECRESLSLLARLSAADLAASPDLYADQFVCLIETGRIDEADAILSRIPESLRGRSDVAAATRRVNEVKRPTRTVAVVPPPQPATATPPRQTATPQPATSSPLPQSAAPQPRPASSSPVPQTTTQQPKPASSTPVPQTATPQPKSPAPATATQTPAVQPRTAVPAPVSATTTPQPRSPVGAVSRPRSAEDVLASARLLVRDRRFPDAVRELKASVAADGTNRAVRLALLEAAALAKDWASATEQMSFLTPLARGEEQYMFYAAMTMYETGRRDDARPLMEQALPRIVASPLVNYYAKVVLGRS